MELLKLLDIYVIDTILMSRNLVLSAEMTSPLAQAGLQRNPAYKNQGKFFTLSDFLDFAKAKAVPGILINIQVTYGSFSVME